ncbi:hypothetical protein ACRQ5Q_24315 [Bradyrhizobium sp. PMVTL-01]|uniref:hypothetical protein n=1 Tax=Bradyrhizobium sp. PMVTL-01 TaxID=3434999 RepID=UPI003F6FD7C1
MTEYIGVAAFAISAAMFAFTVFDRIYGAGARAATAEVAMKTYVDRKIDALRDAVFLKHDTSEGNIGTTIQHMKDLLHKQEIEALTFRAEAAEKYMRRDSYYASIGELKTDFVTALEKLDTRLGRMESSLARARSE